MKTIRYIAVFAFALVCVASSAHALGFRNPDQGLKATGRGEAFVATADDPSAIWYNPAGLTTLKGTHAYVGGYFIMPKTTVNLAPAAGGGTAETDDTIATLPQIYISTDFGFEKLRFGLGVNSPFGLSIDWGNMVAAAQHCKKEAA
jgi:long-chain fatty acid transport protein